MNLDRLRTFQAVTATLHFGRAAERLGLSQPAVSQQVAHLEEELGTALFERIGRRIYLTPAGQALSVEAGRIFAAIDRATEAVRALASGEAGSLRVGASTTPGIYLVPEVLGRFRSDLPQVKLAFRIANSAEIERALLANELDLGIAGARFNHDELFEVTLGQDRIMAIGSPTLLGRTRRARIDDLSRWPLLGREQGSGTQAAVSAALARRGARVAQAFELPPDSGRLPSRQAGDARNARRDRSASRADAAAGLKLFGGRLRANVAPAPGTPGAHPRICARGRLPRARSRASGRTREAIGSANEVWDRSWGLGS